MERLKQNKLEKDMAEESLGNKLGLEGDALGNAIFGGIILVSALTYVAYSVERMVTENLPSAYEIYSSFVEGINAASKCY